MQSVASDNKIIANASSGTDPVSIAPESTSFNEPIQDVIFERNWIILGPSTITGLTLQASQVSIRNNIFDWSATTTDTNSISVSFPNIGTTVVPTNNWIYDNTIYSPTSTTINRGIRIANQVGVLTIQNNLMYSPSGNGSSHMVLDSTPATSPTASNNSSDGQIKSTDPLFTNGSGNFSLASDYTLGIGSYGLPPAGTNVPVFNDFLLNAITQGSYPIGAMLN